MSFRKFISSNSIVFISVLDRKSAGVIIEPELWAITNMYCNIKSRAIQSAEELSFAWITDLMSVSEHYDWQGT